MEEVVGSSPISSTSIPYTMPFDLEADEIRFERRRKPETPIVPPGSTLSEETAGILNLLMSRASERVRDAAMRKRDANPRPPSDLED